jgi:tetratricopeptide (TPR) repeat protein
MFLRIFFLLVLFTGCRSNGNQQDVIQSRKLCEKAEEFISKRDFNSGEKLIRQALDLDINNSRGYNDLAYIKFHSRADRDTVLMYYSKSIQIAPHYDVALYSIANFYYEIKDYKSTIEACNEFIDKAHIQSLGSTEIQHISDIKENSIKYCELVGGVPKYKAMQFFDTINNIMGETRGSQQKFIDKLTLILQDMANYKGKVTYRELQKLLQDAIKSSTRRIISINRIAEVDSASRYKETCINYSYVFKDMLEDECAYYLNDKEHLGILGMRRLGMEISPKLKKIKKAELLMRKSKDNFRKKFNLS